MCRQATVVSAVPTPFTTDGTLDVPSAQRLFASVAEHEVDALMVAGTTGEFPALYDEERVELFRVALRAAGPDRVIAHVGAPSAYQAIALTAAARTAGVTRIAALTPYYLPASPAGVADYFRQVVKAAAGADVYAYLFPSLSGTRVTPREIASLATELGLAGVKLSIPGTAFVAELAPLVPASTQVMSGNDALIVDVLEAGGHGVVSGVSPSAPGAFLELAAAYHEQKTGPRVTQAQAVVDRLVAAIGSRISLGKTALADLGLISSDTCRMAIDPVTTPERVAITSAIAAANA